MFEKDEDYRKARKESKDRITKVIKAWCAREEVIHDKGFEQGAEFGYNKANEWNYPSKGELPKASGNYILAFYGAEGSEASGKPCCEEIYFDAELLRWKERDTYDDLPYLEKKGVVIAWRELPEPPKEEE